ncbi:hypothetical protein M430DRAFT_40032 [Amorphotheca resinae ATCC 22711]|uniref:Uncharacterized protein n=1 Tax=Amorphotheca resinae ATCC 22711 TaxID=857342 RepID=A0A2T3B7G1_AMORE|nr:hypothetical protein M430DRAFT_40032 [Amorphotheca resinae ATCC 22711]PSS22781.1 hypothetical protein M430DRAFT_40032 [Amorphotheca resinae ATCC 22711]
MKLLSMYLVALYALFTSVFAGVVQQRAPSDALSVLKNLNQQAEPYTNTINSTITPLSKDSSPADLSAAATVVAQALQGLEGIVTNAVEVLTGNEPLKSVTIRQDPTGTAAASTLSALLAEISGLSWQLQDLFGLSGPVGQALGPLVSSVTNLWAVVLAL